MTTRIWILILALATGLAQAEPSFTDYRQVRKAADAAEPAPEPAPAPAPVPVPPTVVESSKPAVAAGNREIVSPLGKRMVLKFNDEFDGVVDGDGQRYIDRSKWITTFWQGDSERSLWQGNKEVELLLDKDFPKSLPVEKRINPFSFDQSGVLTISAKRIPEDLRPEYIKAGEKLWKKYWRDLPFSSGLLCSDSKFTFKYGYVEGRFKLPANRGAWPAFWMLPFHDENAEDIKKHPWPPEIDIFEFFGHRPEKYTSHVILPKGEKAPGWKMSWNDTGKNIGDDFHVWGMEWNEKEVVFIFDGKIWARANIEPCPSMHKPMYLLIHMAIGGKWYADEMRNLGTPYQQWEVDEESMPWRMECDYVRVYQEAE